MSARVIHVVGNNSSFFISVFIVHLLYQFIHSVLMNIWIVSSLWSLLIKLLLKALCLSFSEHVLLFPVGVFPAMTLLLLFTLYRLFSVKQSDPYFRVCQIMPLSSQTWDHRIKADV